MIIYFTIQAHFSLDVVTPCTLVWRTKIPSTFTLLCIRYVYICYRVISICGSCVFDTIFILIFLELNEIITGCML